MHNTGVTNVNVVVTNVQGLILLILAVTIMNAQVTRNYFESTIFNYINDIN